MRLLSLTLLLAAIGCAATSKQLELCYGRADAQLVDGAARECPAGLEGCPDEPRLEREHWAAYEACLAQEESR